MPREQLLDAADFVVLAAVPRDRADLAIEAMRRGKDVMVDKPGVTTLAQLEAIEAAVRETGRVWSVALGRLTTPSVQAALAVARSGELGRLVSLTSLAPHRLNRALRPDWFFEREAYGGIICDIGVHSIDQFLAFAGVSDAEIAAATIGCFGTEPPGFEDFAEVTLRGGGMTGTMRLDWFTPDGLPDWGDGRVVSCRHRGDAGAAQEPRHRGPPRVPTTCRGEPQRTRYVAAGAAPVTYYRDFLDDLRDRGERGDGIRSGVRVLPVGVALPGACGTGSCRNENLGQPQRQHVAQVRQVKGDAALGGGEVGAGEV